MRAARAQWPSGPRARLLLLGCVGACLVACAGGGVPLEEVSSEPIALLYWDPESARERAEILEELTTGTSGAPVKRGVAQLESVTGLVTPDAASSPASSRLRRTPGRLVLLDPRTLEITPVHAAPPNARPLAWSSDHRHLLYNAAHLDGGTTQLYQYDLESGEVRKLTHGPDHHLEGDYAPDGRLAVAWMRIDRRRRSAGLDLRPKGGGVGERVFEGAYPSNVQWSPDGSELVYVYADNDEDRIDRSQILRQEAKPGAEPQPLTRGREPVYSPRGDWIVYAAQSGQSWRLARMRPDGSARRTLGTGVRPERWPAVSPDGRHIVYVTNEGHYDHLFIRRIDGTGERLMLREGSVAFPVW